MTPTPPKPAEDPLVTKYVEAALDPYRDRMPPEDLDVYRARLCLYYETNPEAVALLDEIRQEQQHAPVVARSGEQAMRDDAALAEAVQRKLGGSKGERRVTMQRDELTAEQWRIVEEALPEVYALTRSLARRCSNHTQGELDALAEDSLRRRVRNFDPSRGKKLMNFARRGVRLDLIRAAFERAHDPCVAAGLRAIDRHEAGIEHPDVGARFAETPEEKDARAQALGNGLMGAGYYAHAAARAARTPEEELGGREEWEEMRRDAEASGDGAGQLLSLLYEHDMGWEEAAEQLGIDVRQAQRIEQRALARLRTLILGRRGRGWRTHAGRLFTVHGAGGR